LNPLLGFKIAKGGMDSFAVQFLSKAQNRPCKFKKLLMPREGFEPSASRFLKSALFIIGDIASLLINI